MSNYLWVINKKRQDLLDKLTKIPEAGRKPKSVLIEMALEEFILKHGASQNPQTKLKLFENNLIKAIPNLYADSKEFRKFYRLVNKAEYQELDRKINALLGIHNENLRRFG